MKVVEGICERLKSLADHVVDLSVITRKMVLEIWEEYIWTVCHNRVFPITDALNVKN